MEQVQTKAMQTANRLRQMIIDEGLYKVGQKLPNENTLSSSLGISRTTLREAIHILVSEGILVVERGNGTFVASQLATSARGFSTSSDMKVTLRDLYETRMIFEPEAAALACKRASDAEIAHILKLGEEVQKWIVNDPEAKERIETEVQFHSAIIRACHNEFLSQFMPIINETIEQTFALKMNLDVIAEDAYKDHILIMEFLKNRDAQG